MLQDDRSAVEDMVNQILLEYQSKQLDDGREDKSKQKSKGKAATTVVKKEEENNN